MRNKITEDYSSSVESKLCKVEDLSQEMKRLTASLRASISIEAIWPRAFDNGVVRFSGIQKHCQRSGRMNRGLVFTEAWFVNDKVKHYLTSAELVEFKPEAAVHDDFQCYKDEYYEVTEIGDAD